MHYLSSLYFINQPLHVSGIFVAHSGGILYIYSKVVHIELFSWLSVGWPTEDK
jgi:hypothetical protein